MKKKLVESTIGVRTTEPMARRIDQALKSLPKDSAYHFRRRAVTTANAEVKPGERTDISYVNTGGIDRDNEIIEPQGIELDEYRSNPIVLFGHDQDRPVGKCLWIKPNGNGLLAKTYYPSRPKGYEGEWLTDFVFSMIQAEVLKGKSIGALPLEIRDPSRDEVEKMPKLQCVISRCLLIEYSVVSIPSNPQALVDAVAKGISLDYWGWKKVGTTKKAKPRQKVYEPLAEQLKRFNLDPEKIAEQAVRNIQSRWEV